MKNTWKQLLLAIPRHLFQTHRGPRWILRLFMWFLGVLVCGKGLKWSQTWAHFVMYLSYNSTVGYKQVKHSLLASRSIHTLMTGEKVATR